MRTDTAFAYALDPFLFNQTAQRMECSSSLESAYALLVLAFEE